jgi:hypothetical protein
MSERPSVEQSPNEIKAGREKSSGSADLGQVPEPEVVPKAKRRNFTQKDKLRIIKLADACTQSGQIGAMLRSDLHPIWPDWSHVAQ